MGVRKFLLRAVRVRHCVRSPVRPWAQSADMKTTDTPQPHRPDAPLDIEQAALYLNVTKRVMRRLVSERRIAFHRVGRLLRFRVADLDAFFCDGRVEPPPTTSVLGRIDPRAR